MARPIQYAKGVVRSSPESVSEGPLMKWRCLIVFCAAMHGAPAAVLHGTVTDSESGIGIAAVQVKLALDAGNEIVAGNKLRSKCCSSIRLAPLHACRPDGHATLASLPSPQSVCSR